MRRLAGALTLGLVLLTGCSHSEQSSSSYS